MPDCKRQHSTESEDESTVIVANLTDLDMDEWFSAFKSRFTAQGALLLDIETEDQANMILETKTICGLAISARVPHSYMKNTCIIKGVPRWYSDEELLTYLRPQGVYHARRVMRRVQTSPSEWESRRTGSVVLTFAPNSERPDKINLGFTRHELVDYVETPPRCFKCQRFGHVAKHCRGEQRCKRCGGPHDFKTCTSKEKLVCANCGGDHPASYGRCPARTAAQRRNKTFVLGPKTVNEPSNTKKTSGAPQHGGLENEYAGNFPRLKPTRAGTESTQVLNAAEERITKESAKRTYADALSPPQVPSGSNQQENFEHVIRALFTALRSHVAKMPASSTKDMLEAVLALEPPDSWSAIDLVLHSTDLLVSSTTAPDRMGSDHFPIFTNILGFRTAGRQFCNVTRWDTYREALEESTVPRTVFWDLLSHIEHYHASGPRHSRS
ncbi:hypothetical protein HPB52_025154 [Rhipicephalus sanguineus]|uniref:CCHC-type domain-containing protein n=1 Tax=Rhipicephalus sanguineus TaxID=34632 RepID=A0A9D4YRX0_RHISA|nr:hypothetical protein HPB52_025154 [Rhipicephalus sanguineus]